MASVSVSIAAGRGWKTVGGTLLFRLYETEDADTAQQNLARHHIWSRVFPWSGRWLRLGLPDGAAQWKRVQAAIGGTSG